MSSSETPKYKSYLKFALKILIAGVIMWLVYTKIDSQDLVEKVKSVQVIWLLPAAFFFALSKYISTWRLHHYLKVCGVQITFRQNLKLYWLGLFYNLFLPGGIGGDGYKVYLFHKKQGIPTKKAIVPMLLDRVNGMYSLYLWIVALELIYISVPEWPWLDTAVLISLPASLLICILVLRKWFPKYPKVFFLTLIESLAVQGAQIVSFLCLLKSLQHFTNLMEYTTTFLVSSIISIVPITPGGVGLREFTFQTGGKLLGFDPGIGVLCGSLFFAITLVVSFVGIIYHFKQQGLVDETRHQSAPDS